MANLKHRQKIRHLVPALLRWFSQEARDLPWRRSRHPYAIWVSEIMLQQTQVKTVIPFWERWMQTLPTIASLAEARSGKIHKLWEGLGYYTRVRNLQRAAQLIVERHGGEFPETFEDVLALPGIGRYTAGAICSIAFDQPHPVLDGNVIRVLTRLFGIQRNVREKETVAELWNIAEALVMEALNGRDRTGRLAPSASNLFPCSHLNQSLMELGALVCTPKTPQCHRCPVMEDCVARKRGWISRLPRLGSPASPTRKRFAAFVASRGERLFVRQRPAGVVNAHLWEFPNFELVHKNPDLIPIARVALGFKPRTLEPVLTIRHSITRYRIELNVFRAVPTSSGTRNAAAGQWLTRRQLEPLAFASAHKKILEHVMGKSENRNPNTE
jgi:A/G-specific adenine glycosylase